jgi:homoserine trans-succinylase
MSILSGTKCRFRQVVVVINARPTKLVTEIDTFRHLSLTLHSIQVCIYFIHAHTDE